MLMSVDRATKYAAMLEMHKSIWANTPDIERPTTATVSEVVNYLKGTGKMDPNMPRWKARKMAKQLRKYVK